MHTSANDRNRMLPRFRACTQADVARLRDQLALCKRALSDDEGLIGDARIAKEAEARSLQEAIDRWYQQRAHVEAIRRRPSK